VIVLTAETSDAATAIVPVALLLFAVLGSLTTGGAVAVAVLAEIVPEAGAVPEMVYVTEPPAGSVGIVEGFVFGPQAAPLVGAPQVNVTLESSTGSVSVKTVPSAASGPALPITT